MTGSDGTAPSRPPAEQGLARLLARNFRALLGSRAAVKLSGLVAVVILARFLGEVDFGRYTVAVALVSLLVAVVEFGTGGYLVREGAQRPEELGGVLGQVLLVRFGLGVAGILVITGVGVLLGFDQPTVIVLVLLALAAGIRVTGASFLSALQSMEHVGDMAVIQGWHAAIQALLMAAVAVGGGGLPGVALSVLAAALLVPLWGRARLRRYWKGAITVRLRGIGAALRRTGPFAASSAMFTVLTFLDSVMVNAMRGNAATGLYGAAYRVLLAFTIIPAVYTDATARSISFLARADRARMDDLFRRAVVQLLMLAIPIAVAGVILAGPILAFLFGPDFTGAATALALLIPSVLVSFPGWLGVSVAYALGLERRLVLLTGAVVLANALANLALIPAWGIRGAAASTLGGDILILAGMAVLFRRAGLRWPSGVRLAKLAAAGAIMLGLMIPLRTLPLVIPIAVGVTAYVAVLFLLRAFEAEDRELLRGLFSRAAPTRELDGAP